MPRRQRQMCIRDRHFLKCVQGKEIPEVDGEQASRALKIADFIESAVDNSGDAVLLENPV